MSRGMGERGDEEIGQLGQSRGICAYDIHLVTHVWVSYYVGCYLVHSRLLSLCIGIHIF